MTTLMIFLLISTTSFVLAAMMHMQVVNNAWNKFNELDSDMSSSLTEIEEAEIVYERKRITQWYLYLIAAVHVIALIFVHFKYYDQ